MASEGVSGPARTFWWLTGTALGVVLLAAACWGLLAWRYATAAGAEPKEHAVAWRALAVEVPEGERAWPAVVAYAEQIEAAEPGISFYNFARPLLPSGEADPDEEPRRVAALAWLTDHTDDTDRLLRALEASSDFGFLADAPDLAGPLWEGPWALATLRPDAVGAALRAEAHRAGDAGDEARVLRVLLALHRLAGRAAEPRGSRWMQTSLGLHHLFREALAEVLDAGRLDQTALGRIANAVAADDPRAVALAATDAERLVTLDAVERLYTPGGRLARSGHRTIEETREVMDWTAANDFDASFKEPEEPTPLDLLADGPLLWAFAPRLDEVRGRAEAMLEAQRGALTVASGAPADLAARRLLIAEREIPAAAGLRGFRARHDPVFLFADGFRRTLLNTRFEEAARAATLAALAAHRFHRETGRFPATPAEAGAADRSPMGLLFFTVRGGRLLVHAAGADGDDDGGAFPPIGMGELPTIPRFDPDAVGTPADGDVPLFGLRDGLKAAE